MSSSRVSVISRYPAAGLGAAQHPHTVRSGPKSMCLIDENTKTLLPIVLLQFLHFLFHLFSYRRPSLPNVKCHFWRHFSCRSKNRLNNIFLIFDAMFTIPKYNIESLSISFRVYIFL